jgi:hypothetical protein
MSSIRKIVGSMPHLAHYEQDRYDVAHGFLWDSVSLKAHQRSERLVQLFSQPIGLVDPYGFPENRIKTLADTNMQQSQRLPAPESFNIERVIFTFSRSTTDHDLYDFAERGVFSFWLGCRYYLRSQLISLPSTGATEAPIRICDFCSGVYAGGTQCPGCGASSFTLASLGEKHAGRGFVLELHKQLAMRIEQQQQFYVTIELDCDNWCPSERFKFWCHLEGQHMRGIQ